LKAIPIHVRMHWRKASAENGSFTSTITDTIYF
jgi:hypothetical protein